MESYTGQDFEFTITNAELRRHLRLANDPEDEDYLQAVAMLDEALACSRPRFAYAVAAIDKIEADYVEVEGHRLDSALVSKNLANVHRIFPYIATCGREAEEWSSQYTDIVEHYWAENIKILLLGKAMSELRHVVQRRHFPKANATQGEMARMTPGSLPAWPLTQQRALFALMGDLPAQIGVSLTESCLMLPAKSGSGFFFTSETDFVSCRFCPLLNCPNRSAEYQSEVLL
jgi:hypothetical protein